MSRFIDDGKTNALERPNSKILTKRGQALVASAPPSCLLITTTFLTPPLLFIDNNDFPELQTGTISADSQLLASLLQKKATY